MNTKEANFVSAVVYRHNDDNNIYEFLKTVNSIFNDNFKSYEIIVVNDNLDDSIVENVRKFKYDYSDVTCSIVSMGFKHGLEASMNAGVDFAVGDFCFEFDSCYMDYNDALIMEVYETSLKGGFDIVAASPLKNRLSSKFFYSIYNKYSRGSSTISTERFRVISRRALNRIYSYSKNIPYRKSVYSSIGLNIYRLKYNEERSTSGAFPKDTFHFSTAINSFILFTSLAYRFTFGLSVFMALIMFMSGIYTVAVYFGQNKPVPGWAPLMGLISLGFWQFLLFLL